MTPTDPSAGLDVFAAPLPARGDLIECDNGSGPYFVAEAENGRIVVCSEIYSDNYKRYKGMRALVRICLRWLLRDIDRRGLAEAFAGMHGELMMLKRRFDLHFTGTDGTQERYETGGDALDSDAS